MVEYVLIPTLFFRIYVHIYILYMQIDTCMHLFTYEHIYKCIRVNLPIPEYT